MRVEKAMTRDVFTVAPDTSLKAASELFLIHEISGLPVIADGRLVGVISESDIVAKETSGYSNGELSPDEARHLRRERMAETVGGAMTPNPITVEPWMSIWAAADLMVVHDVNRLPVVDLDGALVGIVTRDDLVRASARSDRDLEREIREQVLPSVGLSTTGLDVHVAHGIVTIAGEPQPEHVEQCLRDALHLVPGVVRVNWNVEAFVGAAHPVA